MMYLLRQLYLSNRLFIIAGATAALFAVSFFLPFLFVVAQLLLVLLAAITVADAALLFNPSVKMSGKRIMQKIFSLGDENSVVVALENNSTLSLRIRLIDELPEQFQRRDFSFHFNMVAGEKKHITYSLLPVTRGNYHFGDLNLLLTTGIGLCHRRLVIGASAEIHVYPSIVQMKRFELKAISTIATHEGIRKLRRIGHSYEFEEIKEYVRGDDHRSINWKASGRRHTMMVNRYADEKAQQVYVVIDRSRTMRMPFHGMSLLDYAVNTSLVMANLALRKSDKAGLMSFADKYQSFIKADRGRRQLQKILEALFAQHEENMEANFELLYRSARYHMHGRSLVFLFTNFESRYALERVLPVLRRINRLHLLVVVFFQNAEVDDFSRKTVTAIDDIYEQTIAKQFLHEKMQLGTELQRYGIQSILSRPEELSVNTVNKYLEFKSRGLI